jgi:hypothetical protein
MSWLAALSGSIIHGWGFDDVLLPDGSAHGINRITYHYSWERNGRQEDYDRQDFRRYLESCEPTHGSPTIHYEGMPTRAQAERWNEILDDLGSQEDLLIIPALAANLQEAVYCMLNIVTKNVIEDKRYLRIVTGIDINDDDSLNEASKILLPNWSLMSGVTIPRAPKQSFTISDVISNAAFNTMKDNLCRIFNRQLSKDHIAMIEQGHNKMLRLNKLNWQLSQSLIKNGPDHRISNLKPGSLILKTLDLALRFRLTSQD